jgi:hypothetical protein
VREGATEISTERRETALDPDGFGPYSPHLAPATVERGCSSVG